MRVFLYIFILLASLPVYAAGDISETIFAVPDPGVRWGYVVPNEVSPYDGKDIYAKAPVGTLISVGSERAYFGYLLGENINSLIIVDRNPGIIAYHRTMRLLFLSAKSREDFLYLRLHPDLWDLRLDRTRFLPDDHNILTDSFKDKWRETAEELSHIGLFIKPQATNDPFYGVDYNLDDQQFLRLKKLYEQDKVRFLIGDLVNASTLQQLKAYIRALGNRPSVFDFSNLFSDSYLKAWEQNKIINSLAKVAWDNTIWISTRQTMFVKDRQTAPKVTDVGGWTYYGITHQALREIGQSTLSTQYLSELEPVKELPNQLYRPSSDQPQFIIPCTFWLL